MKYDIEVLKKEREQKTLKQLGQKYHRTPERMRQILLRKESKRCSIHDVFITKECRWCKYNKDYQLLLSRLKKDNIQTEIKRFAGRDRTKETSLKRTLLIRKLHDEYRMSFRRIGKELGGRDHTTILHLYYNH